MRRLLILFLLSLPMIAMAEKQQALGRLFFTPEERAALDIVRQTSKSREKNIQPKINILKRTKDNLSTIPVITIQGYIKRDGGKGTVWVNKQALEENASSSEVKVNRLQNNLQSVQLKLSGNGKTVSLKAGQSYDPANGKISDLYETRAMRLEPTENRQAETVLDKTLSPQDVSAHVNPLPTKLE